MKLTVTRGFAALLNVGLLPFVAGAVLLPALPVGAQTKMPMASPFKAVSTTWMKVEASAMELDKTIRAGKLSEVHEVAFAVRDDVVTLPAKSAALPSEKKKKLGAYVAKVSETAKLLDKYGDSNDAKGVKAQYEQMKTTLAAIKALYPMGTFKPMPDSKMPVKGMKMEHKMMKDGKA